MPMQNNALSPDYGIHTRAHYSEQSESHFFRMVEDIGGSLEPTQTQLDTLARSYKSTGEYLIACPEFEGLLLEIYPHGSRELGTMTRPRDRDRDGFDIDLAARLAATALNKYGHERGPEQLLNLLFQATERYAQRHGLKIRRWDRCVTLEYADGMCADIAPIIDSPHLFALNGDTHGRIPDKDLRRYQSTNPRGYAKEFNRIGAIAPVFGDQRRLIKTADESMKRANLAPLSNPTEVFNRLLCRFIQILKLHRNVAFSEKGIDPDLAPPSIFISTLAALAYENLAPRPHSGQLDLLLDIVENMPQYFERRYVTASSEEWRLENRTAPDDNLASGMCDRNRQIAFNAWHEKLQTDLHKILQSIENRTGVDNVIRLVDSSFGEKAAQAAQQAHLRRQNTLRSSGRSALFGATGSVPLVSRSHSFFGE